MYFDIVFLWGVPFVPIAGIDIKRVCALLKLLEGEFAKLLHRPGGFLLPDPGSFFFDGGESLGAEIGEGKGEFIIL